MKKILYSVMAMAALTFSFTSLTSCEDVPAPYEIPGDDQNKPDNPDEEKAVIFNETFGNADASSKPTIDSYTGWVKTGTGATDVTYSGDKTSVRSSGIKNTGAYDNASGPNVIFFGAAPSTFTINNIALDEAQTKLKLNFGASSSVKGDDGVYNNTFDASKFIVSVSADGTKWTDITYEKNNGDEAHPYWIYATANVTLKKATTKLYIKFTSNVSSAIRLDDVTLTTGEGGQEIDLDNGTATPTTPDTPDTPGDETTAIFKETCGNADVSSTKPYVDKYTGWTKEGTGASEVTYTGVKTSVRSTGLANSGAYDNASGPNVIFFGTAPSTFAINDIALTSAQTKLKLNFGASCSVKGDNGYNNSFDASKFIVSVSTDGTNWTNLTYDKNDGDATKPYWIYATANFTLKKAVSKLYIKFTANISSAIRLDDIVLTTGKGGQEIDL